AALEGDAYAQGVTYRKLLDARLVRVTIVCSEPNAAVTLDGKLVLTGPGTRNQFLLPGEHQVVATKPGFLTASITFVGAPGEVTTKTIAPNRERPPATRIVRHWAPWLPWAVLTGGVVIAGFSLLPYRTAQ